MNRRNPAFLALVIVLTAAVAPAAEAVWPKSSASDLSMFVTMLRYRIYADHCSIEVPRLKSEFDSVIADISSRLQGISKGLLATDVFRGMQGRQVPAQIIEALKDSFHDVSHNVERQDAASICPKALKDIGEANDESLESALTVALTSVKNMIQRLDEQSAP